MPSTTDQPVTGQKCTPCGEQTTSSTIAQILVALLILCIIAFFVLRWRTNNARETDRRAREASAVAATFEAQAKIEQAKKYAAFWQDFSRKLKMFVAKMQVTTFLAIAYSVALPDFFDDFAALMGLANLDFSRLLPLACYVNMDMLDKVMTSVGVPVAIVLIGVLLRMSIMRGWTIVSPAAFYVFVGCPRVHAPTESEPHITHRAECMSMHRRRGAPASPHLPLTHAPTSTSSTLRSP